MNPLFAAFVFASSVGYTLISLPWLKRRRAVWLHCINILSFATFVILSWYLNKLTIFGIILYSILWSISYLITLDIPTNDFLIGRAILATLISSVTLYSVDKISILLHLRQGWAGYITTVFYGIGEIIFLVILIYFTADTVRAISLSLGPYKVPSSKEPTYTPFVSIHVPACNEPIEVVVRTLLALSRISYPKYEVIVIDNNTDDISIWAPIKEYCDLLGFRFMHVNPYPGYKAGALNLALTITSPAAELIAIVDADNELIPEFLQDNVGEFIDPNVAFTQTAQRNRNASSNTVTCEYNPVYDFFYDITMLARSQRNSIIFAGSAGLIRHSALREVGGWAEWSITEDAELSLRLLKQGYKGIYIHRSYGLGLMPEAFCDIRRQWFRYYFGGIDIMIRHLRSTLLADNKLSLSQRIDYTLGGIINLGAALMILSTVGIVFTSLTYSILQKNNPALSGTMFHLFTVFSDWLIVYNCYQVFRMFLLMLTFRLVHHFTWKEALKAAISFQSLITTQARAAIQALSRKKQSFVKTPKQRHQHNNALDLKTILLEIILCAALGIALFALFFTVPSQEIVIGYVLLGFWQTLIYGSTIWRAWQSATKETDREHNPTL